MIYYKKEVVAFFAARGYNREKIVKRRGIAMKVLLFNGSIHEKGCTYTALSEVARVLREEGIETEILWIGAQPVQDCISCGKCKELHRCVFGNDPVNGWTEKAMQADGFVFGSPVYYAHACGRLLSAMDRMFYSSSKSFALKPGAVVVSARRGGTTCSLDDLQKHLSIVGMPVISSTYWNMVHGNAPEEVAKDEEGMQTMRNLGRNMAWILKCIEEGKKAGIAEPKPEKTARTNFIR